MNEPADNAMAWLRAFLPAVDAETIMIAIQAVADMIKKTAKESGEPTIAPPTSSALTH